MVEYGHLLSLAKDVAQMAAKALSEVDTGSSSYRFADGLPREMKSSADHVLEKIILEQLMPTGLPILSEEAGFLEGAVNASLRWIVDPLDGTVNFVRGIAPCAVSIALCFDEAPIFGVICEYPSLKLACGGRTFGAFIEGLPIHVSTIQEKNKAVLCTGFPSRFNFSSFSTTTFLEQVSSYGKVRMLGAASLSLLQVAKGSADAYYEHDIMIWDVAAGLGLLEGAGGWVSVSPGRYQNACNVFASNGLLKFE
jgi:myo-inositol-1(or 4)-monophosphatase